MNGKRTFRLWVCVGVAWGMWSAAQAAPPWDNLIPMKGVDADPDQAYPLSEANGPWMIVACSFSGDGAEKQAKDLVYELRKRYKVAAYMHVAQFDPGQAPDVGYDRFGNPRKGKYWKYKDDKDRARHPKIAQVAVLAGNYQSAEDPEAQKMLRKIKYATPQCLEVKDGQQTHQDLTGWRMIQKQVYEAIGSEKKKLGPMGHAFLTTNPMLPPEFFAEGNGVDEEIVVLNKGVQYSLLDCPGKYTVQVATFTGEVVIKQDEIKAIENGTKEMESKLAEAAKKADRLTKALRIKGYEAYQFHDRYASIVTVGSFSSVGMPRADGRIEINPVIHKIMQTFGAQSITLPGQAAPANKLQTLDGIPFDIQPKPVNVPKRSISVAMRNRE